MHTVQNYRGDGWKSIAAKPQEKKKNERNPAGKEGEGIIIKNKIKTAVVVTKSGCPVCLFFYYFEGESTRHPDLYGRPL